MRLSIAFVLFFSSLILHAQIQIHNDEFDNGATISNWININDAEQWNAEHLELMDIDTTKMGKLTMMPHTSSWYANYRGTLIHKLVSGNFTFTTNVTATNRAETGHPQSQYSLAGVMLRTPRHFPNGALGDDGWSPGGENYVFLSVGRANANREQFEVKTTTNSNSVLEITNIPTTENVNIRISRIDSSIIILHQLPDSAWVVHRRYTRTDFPDTMQIGFVTYTDWQKVNTYQPLYHNSHVLTSDLDPDPSTDTTRAFAPNLIGSFEFARFDSVDVPMALMNTDLAQDASDTQLLSFLGYETTIHCPDTLTVHTPIPESYISSLHAHTSISASNTVSQSGQLMLTADTSIVLLPNFEVEEQAVLEVLIDGCGND